MAAFGFPNDPASQANDGPGSNTDDVQAQIPSDQMDSFQDAFAPFGVAPAPQADFDISQPPLSWAASQALDDFSPPPPQLLPPPPPPPSAAIPQQPPPAQAIPGAEGLAQVYGEYTQALGSSPHAAAAAVLGASEPGLGPHGGFDYSQASLLPTHTTPDPAMTLPAMDFNGYRLYALGKPVPEELMRMPSGASVAEPGSILDEESGRTFHNHSTGRYFFPNDPAEQDRLDLQHRLVTLLLDGQLHRAPVVSPKNVLDVATGTGIWAIQFASLHPESNVVGTDLSLIQPDNAPPNVSFVKENSEKDEWIFPEPFDFIFLRLVFTCFDDPRVVIRKAFENLQPGGWIEFNDTGFELLSTDGTVDGTNNERWVELMLRAGEAVGRDFLISQKYQQWLVEAGFVDVVEEVVPCPMNNWPSDPRFHMLGKWQMTNADRAIRGTSWKLFRALGMSPEEIEDIVQRTKKDIRNTSIHGFIPWYFVYGRKPFPGEVVGNRAGKQ